MDFFQRQKSARNQSQLLFVLFVVVSVITIAATALLLFFFARHHTFHAYLKTCGLVALCIIVATIYRMLTLLDGGYKIAAQLGAIPLPEHMTDPREIRLNNIVEEIAIASGTPAPMIYILDTEECINALVTGFGINDAVIIVTRGALNKLNRDELQGVIAHEYSHIFNGDMALNMKLVGLLFGLTFIGIFGKKVQYVARWAPSREIIIFVFLFGLTITAIGYVGFYCGQLIKSGINRHREYLADTYAVRFTRLNLGLSGALKKIAAIHKGSILSNENAIEYSHMFFSRGFWSLYGLQDSHPPILKRIQALEPDFTDHDLNELIVRWRKTLPDGEDEDNNIEPFDTSSGLLVDIPLMPAKAKNVSKQVGTLTANQCLRAHNLIDSIPDYFLKVVHNFYGVTPLLIALIYSPSPHTQDKQDAIINKHFSKKILSAVQEFVKELSSLNPRQKIPLALLAAPALRRNSKDKLILFKETLLELIAADTSVSLYNYAFSHLISLQITDLLAPAKSTTYGSTQIKDVLPQISQLMSVMSMAGHADKQERSLAYQTGMRVVTDSNEIAYQEVRDFAATLDPIWPKLNTLTLQAKQTLLEGVVTAISHDEMITGEEEDLLHLICGALYLPLPLLVRET